MKELSMEAEKPEFTKRLGRKFHGSKLRGIDVVVSSFFAEGRFGRMFRNVPVFEHSPDNLASLAKSMIVPENSKSAGKSARGGTVSAPDERENILIPAGYTYLGQFIDHDITFDPASSLQRQNDPDALHNFRTPRFDLDCLYGRGPSEQPYMYQSADHPLPHPKLGFDQRGIMFLLEEKSGKTSGAEETDLPRNKNGRALIGDPRNDENLIVSQLHLLFLKFHNRMVEQVFEESGLTGDDLFKETQRQVRWHYQWVIIHDFLPRILEGNTGKDASGTGENRKTSSLIDDLIIQDSYVITGGRGTGSIRRTNLRFYNWHNQPYLPIEFSAAAYRFGHSMVRPSYFINDFVRKQNNNQAIPIFSASRDPLANLNGFRPFPSDWGIQWKYFFNTDRDAALQLSFKIDTKISTPLGNLPNQNDMVNLAQRNLVRGLRMNLPSGQSIARAMGIEPLPDADLELSKRGAPDFEGDAPLWFYILREAELLAGGLHLGPVGGRIVGETLIGLLAGDPLSWFNIEPNWQPSIMKNGRFGMPELISFALNESGDSNPEPEPDETEDKELSDWREKFGRGKRKPPTFPPDVEKEAPGGKASGKKKSSSKKTDR